MGAGLAATSKETSDLGIELPEEPDVPLSAYGIEDWFGFAFFWVLAVIVFLQFFTRYVLNDSLAWTEEIARYLLICVTFIGAGMAVRKNTHIHVEFFYLFLTLPIAKALSTLVDIARIAFFAYATYLGWQVTMIMDTQRMVVIDWPMSYVFGIGCIGFGIMTIRAIQVAIQHQREGRSALTRVLTEGRLQ
jgi:TRAP-type C4-dicarboxylate transport system permease small subunit